MRKRSDSYWAKRATERVVEAEKNSLPYLKKVLKAYKLSQKALIKQFADLYKAYYKNDNTFDLEALNRAASSGSIRQFKARIKRLGLEDKLPSQYQGRMSRLELLEAQIWEEVKKASLQEQALTTESYKKTYEDGYYKSIYDIGKGINEPLTFSTLNKRQINSVLNSKFYGKNYSQRIWTNTNKLAKEIQDVMNEVIITGQSSAKFNKQIREKFNVNRSAAARLLRTETNYFQNQAQIDSYKELGIEKVKFIATLDLRTSEICRENDGDIVNVKDLVQGENAPPLHPNCRSDLAPYFGEEFEPKVRIARNPETGENELIDNMSYNEWHDKYAGDSLNGEEDSNTKLYMPKPIDITKLKGKPMSHTEADSGKVNPKFGNDVSYNKNCQTCVAAYELRRKGYNVEARPNDGNAYIKKLSTNSWRIWVNKNGKQVTEKDFITRKYSDRQENNVSFFYKMKDLLKPNNRYTMGFNRRNKKSGHIINILTDSSNSITFYDPQSNKEYKTDFEQISYLNDINWGNSKKYMQPAILQVNDKSIKLEIANRVLKKADNGRKIS